MNNLKKIAHRILCGLRYSFLLVFPKDLFTTNINKWFFMNGDKNFLLTHKLSKDSIVFEVGWYTGVFSDKIINLFDPYLYIFEPIEEYYAILVAKYKNNAKVKVYHFGLSDADSMLEISKSNDGTSVFKESSDKESIVLKNIHEFLVSEKLDKESVDLISINIEGWEYQLLDKVLSTTPDLFRNIQVQFHDFVENAEVKRGELVKRLLENWYEKWYSFPFVWELFKK